jgi:hypothetical protein
VGFLQVGNGQPGVGFEGIEGLVAEHFLHMVHVGTTPEQFCGAAAAKRMRGDLDVDSSLAA